MALLFDEPAVVHRPDGVVRVTGPDRVAYLHSLLSQDVEGARPGDVADFLYLDAKGNPLAAGRLVVHAEAVLLVVPPDVAAGFAEALERFRFLMQAEVELLATDPDRWALASVRGPGEVPAPGARSQPMTAAPHGGGLVIRDRSGGVDLLGPAGWVAERVADLGLPTADEAAWDAWRIAAGLPAWAREIVPGRRPQELGLLPTHVHLRKGCYPGQESIAKVHNLGRPRRALAVVRAAVPLAAGMALTVDEATPAGRRGRAGEVTSAAPRPDGGHVGLALLPLDRDGALPATATTPDGAPVTIGQAVGAGLPQPGAQVA